MKVTTAILAIIALAGIIWFFKINKTDTDARKNAISVEARIEKVNCKQRLKGDKSVVAVAYKGQIYYIFFKNQKDCEAYKEKQYVTAYYSKTHNKLFLNL
ncbi:hypothetical protein [Aquimarina agarivorans]|uniref:hypothetical protein n=1 Tax=Aquimarina agarivorans TaxID=980584 RepID=UPI000248E5BA|nr:hypothetical protein [Aquimarina agarivorans]